MNNLAGLAFLDLAQNSIRLSTTLLSKCFKKNVKEPWEWGAEQPWVDHSLEPGEKCDPGAGTGGLLWDQRHPLQPQPPQQSADQLPHRGHHQFARAQGEWEFFLIRCSFCCSHISGGVGVVKRNQPIGIKIQVTLFVEREGESDARLPPAPRPT